MVVIAIDAGRGIAADSVPSMSPLCDSMSYVTSPMALVVGILGPFSFFIMMYTGIVRGKWEGKLTRATAFALSFLSNIEHREYMALEEKGRDDFRAKAVMEKMRIQKAKKIAENNQKTTQKKVDLLKAYKAGKISKKQYEANIRVIDYQNKNKK